jgi:hypothetical protein
MFSHEEKYGSAMGPSILALCAYDSRIEMHIPSSPTLKGKQFKGQLTWIFLHL